MNSKTIQLPDNAQQVALYVNASRRLRLERANGGQGKSDREGTVTNIRLDPHYASELIARVDYDNGEKTSSLRLTWDALSKRWMTRTHSRGLVCYEVAPVQATPVEPAKPEPLKDKEFSDKGVMPSDHAGINEMLKKGFKDIFGGELVPAPAKRTLPSSKALFITASEKYMGLGFNDGLAD